MKLTPQSTAKHRAPQVMRLLRRTHPDARCALQHSNPLELLVATILSAQCTDERVNAVTPVLFQKYRSAAEYADAPLHDLEAIIRPTGFFRQKARRIKESCRWIVEHSDGCVPDTMDDLLELPGVARKTANVILGVAFGVADGVVVDTHVRRLARRLALSEHSDPRKIERDLMQLFPQRDWIDLGHVLIFHGRRVCYARRPDCPHCVVNHLCPSARLPDGQAAA
jgi:endonuclease-3